MFCYVMYVCVHVCTYVRVYVYMYVYMYIWMYIMYVPFTKHNLWTSFPTRPVCFGDSINILTFLTGPRLLEAELEILHQQEESLGAMTSSHVEFSHEEICGSTSSVVFVIFLQSFNGLV